MKKLKIFLKANKAIAAVEFALLAPAFFLIFFGIIEVGLTMFFESTLDTALRAAARAGITDGFKDEAAFREAMKPYMGTLYRPDQGNGKGMKISAQMVDCQHGTNSLQDISASVKDGSFFAKPFDFSQCKQSSAKIVYGAKYHWGGFTNLMGVFLPENLYAVTVVRNEPF